MQPLYELAPKGDLSCQLVQSSIAPIGIGILRDQHLCEATPTFYPFCVCTCNKDRVLVRGGGVTDDPLKRSATFPGKVMPKGDVRLCAVRFRAESTQFEIGALWLMLSAALFTRVRLPVPVGNQIRTC